VFFRGVSYRSSPTRASNDLDSLDIIGQRIQRFVPTRQTAPGDPAL
jgi:hypothetical protein